MLRVAVAGAGGMARVRVRALLSTGQVEISGIASRHLTTAQKLGAEIGCAACYDDYRRLADTHPDALLIEVPHEAQDGIALWALEQRLHVLIGGSLATSTPVANQIAQLAAEHRRVVEAGYEARYSPPWAYARELLASGALGRLVTVRSVALWAGDPRTWYYNQRISGGMPLTHMTYCFINPVRWVAGEVRSVSAYANRIVHTAPELIDQENCVANLLFDNDVLCNMTAGFVAPGGLPAWSVTFIATDGAVEVYPDEGGSGRVIVYRGGRAEEHNYRNGPNAFDAQAQAFVGAIQKGGECRNRPADTVGDVQVAEAIVASVRERRTVWL
ncbi:MAG: Gfo/Idh/MocA family oxidoreductase [Chloroflexi bacterium]|nr:Gfo/Idh/MocA family oxidoreductase [Chloroflexota bacterium]MCL5275898.1 Gfo/Idh/MocA family oxidoreductase [Chloroflexota bacterium]